MITFDDVRNRALETIRNAESLASDYGTFLSGNFNTDIHQAPYLRLESYERAITDISSSLIRITVCGTFSSGKSFLISSLLNETEYKPVRNNITGREVENYFTLLPTGRTQTNSCPLEIRGNADPYYKLEILFEGSKEYQLVAGDIKDKFAIHNLLWAYATESTTHRNLRRPSDMYLNVRGAKLYIPSMPFQAVFYDLPGIGGVKEPYKELVDRALKETDCIIFVSSDARELDNSEIGLIVDVETGLESRLSGWEVFFVLSARNDTLEDQIQDVLGKNNEQLQKYFSQGPFKKARFLAVTPSREAIAEMLFIKDEEFDETNRDSMLAASNLPDLRRRLAEYLQTQSGPARIQAHLDQIHSLATGMYESTQEFEDIYGEDVPTIQQELRKVEDQIATLTDNRLALSDSLNALDETSKRTAITLAPEDLAKFLHRRLDEYIAEENMTDTPVVMEFNRKLGTSFHDWLEQEEYIPNVENALKAYAGQARTQVKQKTGVELYPEQAPIKPGTPGEFTPPQNPRSRENLGPASNLVALILGGGGIVALATGPVGVVAALAIGAIVSGTTLFGLELENKRHTLRQSREEARVFIDTFAEEMCSKAVQGVALAIDRTREDIEASLNGQLNGLLLTQEWRRGRLEEGDLSEIAEKINKLESFKQRAEEAAQRINDVMNDLQ